MRIAMNIGGDLIGEPSTPLEIVDEARRAEAEGFGSAWTVHFSRGLDALSTLAAAGMATDRIELGVAVVPTYPRHPLALAQQAATTQVFCSGRLTLGIGVSHRPVIEGLHGIPFTSPAAHMREYLSVLGPLLRGESVSFHGSFYKVEGGFTVPGSSPVSVVVGALSPRMVRAAGELADGVVTWLAGPRTLAETIVPTLRESARSAGRPEPRVVAGMPVAVTDDIDLARRTVRERFARYEGLANYQQVFQREGVTSVAELAIIGTEEEVEKQLRRYADAGVTELWPAVFPVGDDAGASTRRTRALLARLATEL
ncbi:luciferase [Carbonactinospora thermoautotrophica]|uniref:Luciferase n=1 Tax=Carbonactinospora thermoautotrophica TaxID=1469144 RepID=A0A132MRD4_9ACTN|nr:TIGR03564 family F420-dependent LLM class oxidoreductase [Carbonactinospora thermoautotrophica]KWW97256.1 Luciferase-like monooxygenase [Carbonactinospora thermoautotrophica]KWX00438.1 luciferase [Carbonactinospora thermoautotrophica]KWX09588.1 luciferase [Carbonactinospora thermoautotrophica]